MKNKRGTSNKIAKSLLLISLCFGVSSQGLIPISSKEIQQIKSVGDILKGANIRVELDATGIIKLYRNDVLIAQSTNQPGYVKIDNKEVKDFIIESSHGEEGVLSKIGLVNRLIITSKSTSTNLKRVFTIDVPLEIDGAIHTKTEYQSSKDIVIQEATENEFSLVNPDANKIWSYNGGGEGAQSYYDTLQKVSNNFMRANRQDETAAGIPVADIYSVNGGVTVGDAGLIRNFLTTPVKGSNNTATVSIKWQNKEIKSDTLTEVGTSIVSVHNGDYYSGLKTYAGVMAAQGFKTPENIPDSSYDLRWESWGWEAGWTIDKIIAKLDYLKENGVRQVTIDDCWYTAAGDWQLNPLKFPNGDADMKRLVDEVHNRDMTIALWWRPMDGGRTSSFSPVGGFTSGASEIRKDHPDYFIKNKNGSIAKLAGPGGSGSYGGGTGDALCPSSEGAIESQLAFVRRAIKDWKLDGFKSDYVWGVPKCYDTNHKHATPEESTQVAADVFYKAIYNEMMKINPNAFHLLCNCGTPQDYYSLPYVTQIPTADPTSVDQTRRRVKAYKALAGDNFPVTTDHNEIWYPSTIGSGGLMIEKRDFAKGSIQEAEYDKWLGIATTHELHRGTNIGDLYAYGIDPYETYVIKKDNLMYYGFYKDGKYKPTGTPEIVLKGLDPKKTYRIEDYVNKKVIATNVSGADCKIKGDFNSYLLVRAIPLDTPDVEEPSVEPKPDPIFVNVDDRSANVTYTGTWTNDNGGSFLNGTARYTKTPGNSFEYAFTGKSVRWYGQTDTNFGTAKIYIDGVLDKTVSCNGAANAKVKLYEKTGLNLGPHTIKVEHVSETIDLDYLAISQEDIPNVPISSMKPELTSLYISALLKNKSEYTLKTWATLEAQVKSTKVLLSENEVKEEVYKAQIDALLKAIKGLERTPVINTFILEQAIKAGDKIIRDESQYTPLSTKLYKTELDKAKAELVKVDRTQASIIEATNVLNEATKLLIRVDGEVDRNVLQALITQANEIEKDKYTEESYNEFALILKKAENVYDTGTTKSEFDQAVENLQNAFDLLKKVSADKTALATAISNADAVDTSNYTKESITLFKAAIDVQRSILNDEEATQEEVNQAVKNIEQAYGLLVVAKVDTSELENAIIKADHINTEKYTAKSVESFKAAIDAERIVLNDKDATQAKVDIAIKNVEKAFSLLIEKSEPIDPTPENPDVLIKEISSTDGSTTIFGEFPAGVMVNTRLLTTNEQKEVLNKIKDQTFKNNKIFEKIIDISFMLNGKAYVGKGGYTVRIKLDDNLKNKLLSVVFIKEDGTIEHVDSLMKDGYIEFKTDHLSTYGIISNKKDSTGVNTGDYSTSSSWLSIMMVAGFGVLVILYEKKRKANK